MEEGGARWGSDKEITELLTEIRDKMIPHVQQRMVNEHNVAVTKEQAQDITHEAFEEALNTYEVERGKSFKSWCWFKLDKFAIPSYVRKTTYKLKGRVLPREESMEYYIKTVENVTTPQNISSDGANHTEVFNKVRMNLRSGDQQMWDVMRDLAESGDMKLFKKATLELTSKKLGIEKKEAEKAWRRIKYECMKLKSDYDSLKG